MVIVKITTYDFNAYACTLPVAAINGRINAAFLISRTYSIHSYTSIVMGVYIKMSENKPNTLSDFFDTKESRANIESNILETKYGTFHLKNYTNFIMQKSYIRPMLNNVGVILGFIFLIFLGELMMDIWIGKTIIGFSLLGIVFTILLLFKDLLYPKYSVIGIGVSPQLKSTFYLNNKKRCLKLIDMLENN